MWRTRVQGYSREQGSAARPAFRIGPLRGIRELHPSQSVFGQAHRRGTFRNARSSYYFRQRPRLCGRCGLGERHSVYSRPTDGFAEHHPDRRWLWLGLASEPLGSLCPEPVPLLRLLSPLLAAVSLLWRWVRAMESAVAWRLRRGEPAEPATTRGTAVGVLTAAMKKPASEAAHP